VPGLEVIVTGSSSFELAGQVGEPLTGRKTTVTLFPIAQLELESMHNRFELKERVDEYLIFGGYPEVVAAEARQDKIQIIEELMSSYMFKDILALERVRSPKILVDLLRLLAFQLGSEVSHHELAQKVGIDQKTVGRYLELFERTFILYNLRGYSRNLRSEITKKSKYYFYDIGMRNAIISNFNRLELRNDVGALWENFLFMERLKKRAYHGVHGNCYFWRTWEKKEIDLIEERDGNLFAYEFKWKAGKDNAVPGQWKSAYPEAVYSVIDTGNYLDFVL
jgi:predicted AAA+ superfamily ATPase